MTDFRIKLVAIAKDEAAYIPQWVFHHLYFGFDAVEVWVNNSTDESINLLRRLQESLGEEVVAYTDADDFLQKCLEENRLFQPDAYNAVLRKEAERGYLTHLMFMDLDELWTPLNFQDSIKDLLRKYPESDVISFLWMIDLPEKTRSPFSRPFSDKNKFQKNGHVKSLAKLSPRLRQAGIHNHRLADGAVFHLSDGTPFEDAPDARKVYWAYVSASQLRDRLGQPEPYFIVHQINRSQEEYLSSLLRGRRHAGDENVFKVNRVGYIPFEKSEATMDVAFDPELIKRYDERYAEFIEQHGLHAALEEAQQFVMGRYETAVQMLQAEPALRVKHKSQLRGVSLLGEMPPIDEAVAQEAGQDADGGLEVRGEVSGVVLDGLTLSFNGSVFVSKPAEVEIGVGMKNSSFTFPGLQVSWRSEEEIGGKIQKDFEARLPLLTVPPHLWTESPTFSALAAGCSHALAFAKGYEYPLDGVLELRRKEPWMMNIKVPFAATEAELIEQSLAGAACYLAYGGGGTAALAAGQGVAHIIAADSDRLLLNVLDQKMAAALAGTEQVFHPLWANIGKTKAMGYPVEDTEWRRFGAYAALPWEMCDKLGLSPQVVLIAGRFRVASFLTSLLMAEPETVIWFSNYKDRTAYHVVEQVLQASSFSDQLAKFVVPEHFDHRLAVRLLIKYSNDLY